MDYKGFVFREISLAERLEDYYDHVARMEKLLGVSELPADDPAVVQLTALLDMRAKMVGLFGADVADKMTLTEAANFC